MIRARTAYGLVLGLAFATAACNPQPREIRVGHDVCEHCRMQIADHRYGAEIVLDTGRLHVFDSIECMADWVNEREGGPAAHSVWVTDFAEGSLLEVTSATILMSGQLRSPMGRGLAAFGPVVTPENTINAFGGEVLGWPELLQLSAEGWGNLPRGSAPAALPESVPDPASDSAPEGAPDVTVAG